MNNYEILAKTLEKENALIIEKYNRLENKYKELEQKYSKYDDDYIEIGEKYKQLKKLNEEITNERNAIREQLDSILYSRSYKAIKKFKKILRR